MQGTVQLEKYFAASEITVLAVCFVMLILLTVSFTVRMKSFRIFAAMLYMLIIATLADLTLHYLMDRDPDLPRTVFYALRTIYHTLLFAILHQYVNYTCEATALSRQRRKPQRKPPRKLLRKSPRKLLRKPPKNLQRHLRRSRSPNGTAREQT